MKIFDSINKHWFISYWVPFLIVMAIISYFSLSPMPFTSIGVPQGDSLNFNHMHIAAYLALSILMGIAFRHSKNKMLNKYHYFIAIFYCICFGLLIEFFQDLVPGRSFDYIDIFHNVIGIILGQFSRFVLRINDFFRKIV